MAHPLPIQSWKLIVPWVVSAVKLGASLLILSAIAYLRSQGWNMLTAKPQGPSILHRPPPGGGKHVDQRGAREARSGPRTRGAIPRNALALPGRDERRGAWGARSGPPIQLDCPVLGALDG